MGKKKQKRNNNGFLRTFDKIDRLALRVAPHIASHTGVVGMGNDITRPGLTIGQRMQEFAANEILLHTGYHVYGQTWSFYPMLVNALARVDVSKLIGKVLNGLV